ncbi:hypothetical protein [uncultured Flavonifractor sp.]|uniref:hypothetical protein n=1 Tax=uncultured Flavonifractor sp. TaxID=1193534 RepID=UPI002621531D|nr:hypothetical protein [uncultured Flavonifractor sp.]
MKMGLTAPNSGISFSSRFIHTKPTKTLTEIPPATTYYLPNYTDIVSVLQYFKDKKEAKISYKIIQILHKT